MSRSGRTAQDEAVDDLISKGEYFFEALDPPCTRLISLAHLFVCFFSEYLFPCASLVHLLTNQIFGTNLESQTKVGHHPFTCFMKGREWGRLLR
jgi:hypothetical protein